MKNSLKKLFILPAPIFTLALLLAATVVAQAATKPTLTITKPKNDAKWSNAVYTVVGTVKPAGAAASVVCLVNGTPVSTSLSNTTWNAQITLMVGTNTIDAYAVDTNSDFSATNKVKLIYLLVSPVTETIVGDGTVSPNYNGHTLIIGDKYKTTAIPKAGFGFDFWNVGGFMTNKAALDFTMVTNLSITANFVDTKPPTITIDEPKSGSKESNATVVASGKADDNVGVVYVAAQINGEGWTAATGTSNWTVELPVSAGANDLQAYAEDAQGNISKTNEVKFIGTATQTTWSPASINNEVVLLTPTDPAGPTHFLCYSNTLFSYSDQNTNVDSGYGEGDYMQVETNYGIAQVEFLEPTAISGITANIDLGFTNFNVGFYTNENSGELGTFSIVPTDDLLPASWSGKTLDLASSESSKTSTATITANAFHLVTGNSTLDGTYTVNKVSAISAFFTLEDDANAADTAYFQMTYTSKTEGFYEINYYTDGSLIKTDVGTFKQ